MDKKKLSSGLKMTGFWLSLATLLMFFAPAFMIKEGSNKSYSISLFEYIFKIGKAEAYEKFHYNGVYIVAFVLVLLAIIALAYVVISKLLNKSNEKLNKYLIIGSIVCLFVIAVFAFVAKTVYMGELYIGGAEKSEIDYMKEHLHLASGAIVPAIFSIIGGGSLIGSLVLDK